MKLVAIIQPVVYGPEVEEPPAQYCALVEELPKELAEYRYSIMGGYGVTREEALEDLKRRVRSAIEIKEQIERDRTKVEFEV